jgi:hypothetical protein
MSPGLRRLATAYKRQGGAAIRQHSRANSVLGGRVPPSLADDLLLCTSARPGGAAIHQPPRANSRARRAEDSSLCDTCMRTADVN